jgi:hypothetical protein
MKSLYILACNLNVADGIVAVYLVILLAVDAMYEGNIGYVTFRWKHSGICMMLSVFIMLSIQLSTATTFLIGVDRFMVIVWHPFKQYGLKISVTILAILFSVCFSAVLPSLYIILYLQQLVNNACILIGKSLPLSFTISYIALNLSLFLGNMIYYVPIIKTRKSSRNLTHTNQTSALSLLIRLATVTVTNLIVWLTMCIMTVISLAEVPLDSSLESLVSLLIVPLNSITNPIINTFSTRQFFIK